MATFSAFQGSAIRLSADTARHAARWQNGTVRNIGNFVGVAWNRGGSIGANGARAESGRVGEGVHASFLPCSRRVSLGHGAAGSLPTSHKWPLKWHAGPASFQDHL